MIGETAQMLWSRVMLESSLAGSSATAAELYRVMEAYYLNNGLYEATQQVLYENGLWTPGMKSLRNPAKRVVEFYVAHIWPGNLSKGLPIVTENLRVVKPIQQIWKWSNWGAKKQLAARWFALFGDWFCKVATVTDANGKPTRVFLQNIKPEYVTDFSVDERGVIGFIRIDIPSVNGLTHTEIWDKTNGYQRYVHKFGAFATLGQLGDAQESKPLSDFGIDFVPFVHAPFLDIGELRGVNAFFLALDKIDEANRMATRLHQLIFRFGKPTIAVMANQVDGAGRPMPPPKMENDQGNDSSEEHDDDIRGFPGMSKMEYLVPSINYEAHLKAIDAQMRELEEDLPELSYYRMRDFGSNISGRAARILLSHAIDRCLEARGNIEAALARANMMALTIGTQAGLFKNIGAYENGDFEHNFAERDVIALSDLEQSETIKNQTGAGMPLVTAVRRSGWTEAEIAQLEDDKQTESDANSLSLGQALLEAQRKRDQGVGQPIYRPKGEPVAAASETLQTKRNVNA